LSSPGSEASLLCYPLVVLDESRSGHVTELLVDVQHRGVLRIVVGADHRHAELDGLGETLELDRPGEAATAEAGMRARVAGPYGAAHRRKFQVGQAHRHVVVQRD